MKYLYTFLVKNCMELKKAPHIYFEKIKNQSAVGAGGLGIIRVKK